MHFFIFYFFKQQNDSNGPLFGLPCFGKQWLQRNDAIFRNAHLNPRELWPTTVVSFAKDCEKANSRKGIDIEM